MAAPIKTVGQVEPRLAVKKGDRVRLLLPLWDGTQRFEAGEEIVWTLETPPTVEQACFASDKDTPLDAPAMTDGRPPEGYIDPRTGQPYVAAQAV
jgi:hypothetical protein